MPLHAFASSDPLPAFSTGLPALDPSTLIAHGVDQHLVFVDSDNVQRARCSLWWNVVPPLPAHRVGVIGHFAADDPAAAAQILRTACDHLRQQGCTLVVGPMDGNTWRSYRFVTEPGDDPPFFLEPSNPPEYPDFFAAAGFTPRATYVSTINSDLQHRDPRSTRAAARLAATGITIRPLNPDRFDDELRAIHRVSRVAFVPAFLYTPLAEDAFLALYRPIRDHVRPELVLLAEHHHEPVGYLFAIPDLAQARRDHPIDTVIAKTLAVLPGRTFAGLGTVLLEQLHAHAHALGYRRVIHALMRDGNDRVQNLSRHYGLVCRRYTLYARPLA